MKRFYLILLIVCAVAVLFFLSNLWFLAGVGLVMILIAIGYFSTAYNEIINRNHELVQQAEELRTQLESLMEKESKARENAEQISNAKRKLLSSMSHEIRTPMNGVIGMASLLAETPLNEEQREYTETILSSGKSLLTRVNDILINDMLDFSRMDTDKIKLDEKKFDVGNAVEEVLDMFAGKSAETGLDLAYQLDKEVPLQVIGDVKRLQQVLINLVENAFRFTERGEIFIGVHLENKENNQLKLAFEVSDSGTGIPAEILDTVFTGILPADYSTKNKQTGAGFGLVICKKLVELMGGYIKAERRNEAEGTTIKFTIAAGETTEVQSNAKKNMMGFNGENILIVDDNLMMRNALKNQLEQWRLLPVLAASGKEALESLTQVSFDIVITDLNMPEMDGIELARLIRKKYAGIPLVLLNPVHNERYKQHAEIFGAIINKPVKQHVLFDAILGEFRHKNRTVPGENINHKLTENFSRQYPLHILVAEDNPVNQKWITKILTRLGYRYKLGNNGKEILEIVSHENYDLILMDVQMPEMDGLEATRMIRLCLETQPVIVAMTANVMQGDREECIQAGMDDYISKPVELAQLINMLEKWSTHIKEKRTFALEEKNV